MFRKVIRGIILVALLAFYAINIYAGRDNLYGAIVLNRVNFVVLLAILYLAADYVKICTTLFMVVLVGGILFHGYMYYNTYFGSRSEGNTVQTKAEKCHGKGSSWYSKLNDNCY